MTHKTRGIVLRTIRYGETSLVVTIFTELFGLQTYMVNGIRTAKKGGSRAALYQPAAILDMEVYHNEQKSMQRIKESTWSVIYINILTEVIRNSIALYMVELLYKTLKQPEQNAELFYFCEDALTQLDVSDQNIAANFPLFFALHLSHFYGFRIHNPGKSITEAGDVYLDLMEGVFINERPVHQHYIYGNDAIVTAELLRIMQVHELSNIRLNSTKRRELLLKYHDYYALHIQDFGQMRTLDVLHEVLS